MTSSIQIQDSEVLAALTQLNSRIEHMRPFLLGLGEDMVDRIKHRFGSATAPDGTKWQSNSEVTIARYVRSRGGVSKKTGKLLAKGKALSASKKPLQGQSGDLARQLFSATDEIGTTVGSNMIYAAMQHFGGAKAEFPHLWGDIPARAFFPIEKNGTLVSTERDSIIASLMEYLSA